MLSFALYIFMSIPCEENQGFQLGNLQFLSNFNGLKSKESCILRFVIPDSLQDLNCYKAESPETQGKKKSRAPLSQEADLQKLQLGLRSQRKFRWRDIITIAKAILSLLRHAAQENFAYVPLSGSIILLVILLTCASRRKKIEAFSAVEQNFENDIKGEYAVMCFPCLKRKPNLTEFEPTEDLTNQFEYIVEKYTIRKVPLLLANTAEDILERQEELEMAKSQQSHPQLLKDNFVNFQVSQEVYNVQREPPCITLAASTACPGKKALKEKQRPSDILESMSPISRPPVRSHNYVVIPTKGSLRHKDIMMTKREITNQYLNNFSSVFVDNLKDQIPKDPEQFPSLSRPYTSAFKNFPIDASQLNKTGGLKKSKKGKTSKVAYAFPLEKEIPKEESSVPEEPYYDSDSGQEQTTDLPESEFQEDAENDTTDYTEKSKSLVLLNESESIVDNAESVANPFKTTIKSLVSVVENSTTSVIQPEHRTVFIPHKEEWPNTKNVTYEDIQALDVGYEFTSCEKLGVKPKMTRIHCPLESEKFKESLKLALGDSNKFGMRCVSQEQSSIVKPNKTIAMKPTNVPLLRVSETPASHASSLFDSSPSEQTLKSVITETSFLPAEDAFSATLGSADATLLCGDSTITFNKSSEGKSPSFNELNNTESATVNDSVTEISKLYDLSRPGSQRTDLAIAQEEMKETNETPARCQGPSKSRSFHEPGFSDTRKDGPEVKGKDNSPYPIPNSAKKIASRINEPDTETTYSLDSPDSKTSSGVTTPRSSEVDEDKRATLRWKIVIKHHREDDSSRRNVNVNIKH